MKIFGKTLSEYIGFEKWILVLIVAVGVVIVHPETAYLTWRCRGCYFCALLPALS